MNKHNYEDVTYRPTFDVNQQLTEHFNLSEMLYSRTCERIGMINRLDNPDEVIPRLRTLCEEVLEPLRRHFGPIRINSGYRSECLNYVVGGVTYSQHRLGEAADIYCKDEQTAVNYFTFIRDNLEFDQLFFERQRSSGAVWVHVSFTRQKENRKMVASLVNM